MRTKFDVLQLRDIDREALAEGDFFSDGWSDMTELEQLADRKLSRLREMRRHEATRRGGLARLRETCDRALRTDEIEYLDDPDFPEETKVKIVRALHRMNVALGSYRRFLQFLKPLIDDVACAHNRPARVLELACGSGEFTLALAERAAREGLPVEVTGSDIVKSYIERGNRQAQKRGIDAAFIRLNAFEMEDIEEGDYDIAFIAQSIHHFSPGQLAMMVAQSRQMTNRGFVGVDGYRSLTMLGVVPGIAALSLQCPFFHDALVTARTFYAETELELIGRLAAPGACVEVKTSWPGYSILEVLRP